MAVLRQVEDTPLELEEPQSTDVSESRTRSAIAGEEPEVEDSEEVTEEGSGNDDSLDESEDDEELTLARELLSLEEETTEKKDEDTNEEQALGPLTPQQYKNLEEVLGVLTGGRIPGDELVDAIQWIRQKRVEEHDNAFRSVLTEAGMPADKYLDVYKDVQNYWEKLTATQQAAANNAQGLRMIYKLLDAEKDYSGQRKQKKIKSSASVKASAVPGETKTSPDNAKRNFRSQAEAIATLTPEEYARLGETGVLDKLPLF